MAASQEPWHLDRKIPISIIVTLLIYGISGLWFVADIKRDVEILKAQRMEQITRDDRQDKSVSEVAQGLEKRLDRIEIKLDRIIESSPHARLGK